MEYSKVLIGSYWNSSGAGGRVKDSLSTQHVNTMSTSKLRLFYRAETRPVGGMTGNDHEQMKKFEVEKITNGWTSSLTGEVNNRCDLAAVYDLFNREVEVSDKMSTGPGLSIGPENVTLFSVPLSCPHVGRAQVLEFLKLKCLRACS